MKVIDVRDDAVGGPAAGGVAAPTALAFAPDPRRPDKLSVLVADDGYKIRTVDVDTPDDHADGAGAHVRRAGDAHRPVQPRRLCARGVRHVE